MAREPFVELTTANWIGGFFIWMLRGFRGPLKDRYAEKYKGRNVFVGWLVQVVFFGWAFFVLSRRS